MVIPVSIFFIWNITGTLWPDGQIIWFLFDHLKQWNFTQKQKIAKVRSNFYKTLKKPQFLCPGGDISPNPVTLIYVKFVQ